MVIEHFKFTSSFQTHFDYMDLSKMVWYGDGADDIISYIKDMRHLKRCLNTDQMHITQLALTHANFTMDPRLVHMIRNFESHRPKQGVVNSEFTFESLMSKLEEHANHELMKKNLKARENTMNQKFERHRKKLLKQGGGAGWGGDSWDLPPAMPGPKGDGGKRKGGKGKDGGGGGGSSGGGSKGGKGGQKGAKGGGAKGGGKEKAPMQFPRTDDTAAYDKVKEMKEKDGGPNGKHPCIKHLISGSCTMSNCKFSHDAAQFTISNAQKASCKKELERIAAIRNAKKGKGKGKGSGGKGKDKGGKKGKGKGKDKGKDKVCRMWKTMVLARTGLRARTSIRLQWLADKQGKAVLSP